MHALTYRAGFSEPTVSKHLGVLKIANLVSHRSEGRETDHGAQPQVFAPLLDWMSRSDAFRQERLGRLESLLNRTDR